jgi:hypothetical protein
MSDESAKFSFWMSFSLAAYLVVVSAGAGLAIGDLHRREADLKASAEYTGTLPNLKGEPIPGPDFYGLPPQRFQNGDVAVGVYFTTLEAIQRMCGKNVGACEWQDGLKRPILVMENPCHRVQFDIDLSRFTRRDYVTDDPYAIEVCHELGHARGWPEDHRGGIRVDQ